MKATVVKSINCTNNEGDMPCVHIADYDNFRSFARQTLCTFLGFLLNLVLNFNMSKTNKTVFWDHIQSSDIQCTSFLTKRKNASCPILSSCRPVGWGCSRGSNEPPKIFKVGIFRGLNR